MELIKTVYFAPYSSYSNKPRFVLRLYDTFQSRDGKARLGYKLTSQGKVIFEGNDFFCSPLHAIDSKETVNSVMGFLCLRKGDTDDEYFNGYTPAQIEFSEQHAESLAMEVISRFGEY